MAQKSFKAKAYLKEGCPYSFKFLLFMAEAGLIDEIELIRCNPSDPDFKSVKEMLTKGLGKPATFPTVEIEPSRYQSEADDLIAYFSRKSGRDAKSLPAWTFYVRTIFPKLEELEKEE